MTFNNLHHKFDHLIEKILQTCTQTEVRTFLYSNAKTFVDRYSDLYSQEFTQKFNSDNLEGISEIAIQERDRIDHKSNSEELTNESDALLDRLELAGVATEMASYLDSSPLNSNDLFNYVYCWGVFEDDTSIIEKLNTLATKP